MSVRMRHTKQHTRNRRSHHALAAMNLVACDNCSALKLRHRVCGHCGFYKGRQVIDIVAQARKKEQKVS